MPLPRTRADAVALFLSGAASAGGVQADPDLSLGGHRSSSRAGSLGVLLARPIAGVRIDYASPGNLTGDASGDGVLAAYDDDSLTWAPPAADRGDPVTILNGEQRLIEGPAGVGGAAKFLIVTRTSAAALVGSCSVSLTQTFNDVFGQANVDLSLEPLPTYRMVVFKAGGAVIKNLALWLGVCDHAAAIAIEQPASQPDGACQVIATESTAPAGLTFVQPTSPGDPTAIVVPTLRPNEQVGIWARRWATPYFAEVLADSPVAYWRLGESAGTNAADASGNGRNGTYGSVTLGVAGALDRNTAITLPGNSAGNVLVADNSALRFGNGQSFTIEGWYKPDPASATNQTAGGKWSFPGRNYLWFVAAASVSLSVNTSVSVSATVSIGDGSWHHVVFVADAAAGLLRIYVDGAQAATAAWNGTNPGGTQRLLLGNNPEAIDAGVGNSWAYKGGMDEIAIYPSALSASRILTHHDTAVADPATPDARSSLVLNWSFTAIG